MRSRMTTRSRVGLDGLEGSESAVSLGDEVCGAEYLDLVAMDRTGFVPLARVSVSKVTLAPELSHRSVSSSRSRCILQPGLCLVMVCNCCPAWQHTVSPRRQSIADTATIVDLQSL